MADRDRHRIVTPRALADTRRNSDRAGMFVHRATLFGA
jgi:hypothetical protein